MYLLRPETFTRRVVFNPRMLKPGGAVGPGSYTRRAKNVVVSPGLIARNEFTARVMIENCRLPDKCVPKGMDHLVGQPVPGKPGKVYTACTDEERARRLQAARECAQRVLATKGGIYGKGRAAGAAPG
jgi:hypothetical protein